MIHSQKIGKQKETYAGFAPIIKISTKTNPYVYNQGKPR